MTDTPKIIVDEPKAAPVVHEQKQADPSPVAPADPVTPPTVAKK